MKYRATKSFAGPGVNVRAGQVVNMTAKEAAPFGALLEKVSTPKKKKAPKPSE